MKPVVKIFITFIPLILILLLVPTSNSSAYTRFHGKYTQTPYNTYYWNGVDQIPTINAPLYVDNAMSMWNNTSNTRIWMVKTTNQSASILDFHSKVLEDINILGRTTWWVGNSTVDPKTTNWYWAKVEMNKNSPYSSIPNPKGVYNGNIVFAAAVAHEIGHALGLAHNSSYFDIDTLMFFDFIFYTDYGIYYPTNDEILGVRNIYGYLY